jgi:hypothetical protein
MEMAEYLSIAEAGDEGARILFALRSGTSDLRVDRERRNGIAREHRCCRACAGRHVEDAQHVLTVCPAHGGARASLLQKLPPTLHALNDERVFHALMGGSQLREICPDPVARFAAIHAVKAFWVRTFEARRLQGA